MSNGLLVRGQFVPEASPGSDFLRIAMLLAATGSFVVGEWLLGITALLLALVSGHGLPNEVTRFRPGGSR